MFRLDEPMRSFSSSLALREEGVASEELRTLISLATMSRDESMPEHARGCRVLMSNHAGMLHCEKVTVFVGAGARMNLMWGMSFAQ